ncbi:unnamed protein product [Echinostoma caproni]|uniref:NTP_transf_9 domain-containing protein n=1 Tax=Echinostoma caproni TaxID=27848 RepID=A0A183B0G5_9TREM|nr:unnamed protein product [Echinostoma caproni]
MTITSCLHDGAVFKGTQRSKSKEYDVEVTIQSVDYPRKTLYGYIKMDNLIIPYGSLTTYFEGEIISRTFPFVTGKWGASVETDIAHWEKFALPRVKQVDGASYAGFYYIGFNKWSGEILGYYYHLDCEK